MHATVRAHLREDDLVRGYRQEGQQVAVVAQPQRRLAVRRDLALHQRAKGACAGRRGQSQASRGGRARARRMYSISAPSAKVISLGIISGKALKLINLRTAGWMRHLHLHLHGHGQAPV